MKNDTAQTKELAVLEPEMEVGTFGTQKENILLLVKNQMKLNQDFGIIPGTRVKTLYQAGAEKLAKFFGLSPVFTLTKEIENVTPPGMFVYYRYRCELIHIATGKKVGEAERSCNSGESGKLKKSVFDLINTCQAMAQKRALVAAVRTATMASDLFLGDDSDQGNRTSVTEQDDPIRVKLITQLYTVATPRGFSDELLHKILLQVFKVDSITLLSNEQITLFKEKLLTQFAIVGKGELPRKITEEEEEVEDVEIEEPNTNPFETEEASL